MKPVVFDEPDDRSLISYSVVDEIFFRPRRDHQQRLTRTVTATAECVGVVGVKAGERRCGSAASARSGQSIGWTGGGVNDWTHLMVIPSVRVVVHDHHSRALPCPLFFEEVDRVD